jgi:hypothetical protein
MNPVANTEIKLAKDIAHFEIAERGEKFVKHAVSDPKLTAPESYALNLSMGRMHYDDGGYWRPVDTTLSTVAARLGADVGQKTAGFETHFNLALSAPWTAEYRKAGRAIRFKPTRLQSGTKKWLVDQTVTGVVTGDTVRWENAFGAGIHLEWETQTERLTKRVILDKPLTLTADLDLVVEVQIENLALPTIVPARFLALGDTSCFRWPLSWDAVGEQVDGKLLLSKSGGKTYLTHRIPRTWLAAATYPVTVDYDVWDVSVSYAVASGDDDAKCAINTGTLAHVFNTTDYFTFGDRSSLSRTKYGSTAWFDNVQVPRGAVVNHGLSLLYMTHLNADNSSATVRLYFCCADLDDAAKISTDLLMHGDLTTAKRDISIAGVWLGEDEWAYGMGDSIGEVVNRDGWREGNSLVCYAQDFDGRSDANAYRQCYDYGHSSTKAPHVVILYSLDDFGQVF